MNSTLTNPKPGLFLTIAWMTLISGIINLFWGFVASATALGTLVGIICLPITILPTILGVFEIIYAAKLLSAQPQPVKPSQSIAVFQILTFFIGNVFSAVVGILSLIFYNDINVREYFASLNSVKVSMPQQTPPALEPVSAPETLPEPAPVEVETEFPAPAEEPAKPKRGRKMAKE